MTEIRELSDCFRPGFDLAPFKPSCLYFKELDWLIYLNRDCSYAAEQTSREELELLKDGADVVGFKVLGFLNLPRALRFQYLYATNLYPDDIRNVEDVLIHNFSEISKQIGAADEEFFTELRRRISLGLIEN